MDLDLNLLIVFDAVMTERNLRKAGERLGRSQPSVSQSMARLRDLVGDQLFERNAQGITPTARAEVLWKDIRDPLAQLREALVPSEFDPNAQTREIVFGLSDDARILFWPKLAKSLNETAPQATLRAIDTNHISVWRDIEAAGMDLAVTVAGQPPPGFGARVLYQDDFALMLRGDAKPPKTPRDYSSRRHLAVVFADERPAFADEALAAAGEERRVVARVSRFDALPGLVKELDAVVALPRLIADHFATDRDLAVCALPVAFPPAVIRMCWRQKSRADLKHQWLRRYVSDTLERIIEEAPPRRRR
ncbi:MAG: LysR family transcriptional regulator [Pseudomonadota bacterium]